MFVLVLGYHYTSNYSPEKVLLKRSSGWEAYVHLAKFGLKFLYKGALFSICLIILEKLLSMIVECLFDKPINILCSPLNFASIDLYPIYLIWILLSFLLADIESQGKNEKIEEKYDELSRINGLLSIVIQSVKTSSLVKISLKSKKVYVGLVDSEQFESADLDNIVVVPFKSGYRNKDTLEIIFDCDYLEVYEKKGINFDSSDLSDLKKFRCSIRVSEIESISLFDSSYYSEFQNKYPKKIYFLKRKK